MLYSSTSQIGLKKKHNQDHIGYKKINNGFLFVVCDGISALPNSQIASKRAVKAILHSFKPQKNIIKDLLHSIEIAHNQIIRLSNKPIGTTIATIYYVNNIIYTAWCGDSRIYHFYNNQLKWMSKDHIVLHDKLNHGIGAPEDFINPTAITRYLGSKINHNTDQYIFKPNIGDKILLCTDGLNNYINELDIINIISRNSCNRATKILSNLLLSNSIKAPDNFSWYIVEINH